MLWCVCVLCVLVWRVVRPVSAEEGSCISRRKETVSASSLPTPPPSGCGNLEIGARAKRRAPGFYTHDRPSVRLDPEARGLRFLADPAAASRHGSGPVWMWRGSSCRAFASARSFSSSFAALFPSCGTWARTAFPFKVPLWAPMFFLVGAASGVVARAASPAGLLPPRGSVRTSGGGF